MIQVILLIFISILIFLYDSNLFSEKFYSIKHNIEYNKNECKSEDSTQNSESNISNEDLDSVFGEIEEEHNKKEYKILEILQNPIYTFSCLSISSLLFISTAVIFWTTEYFTNILYIGKEEVLSLFLFISLIGPILGIFSGGTIVQKFAGGYEGKHSILFCFLFSIFAFLFSLPVGFVSSEVLFSFLLTSILFFGGAIIPVIQGIMISSLKQDLRAAGNSISNIFQNLLGFLPAPFVYGIIYENTKKTQPKLAMIIILSYSLIGVIFIGLTMIFRYKYWEVLNKQRENIILENDEEVISLKMT